MNEDAGLFSAADVDELAIGLDDQIRCVTGLRFPSYVKASACIDVKLSSLKARRSGVRALITIGPKWHSVELKAVIDQFEA